MECLECETVADYFFETTLFWLFAPTLETSCKLNRMCRVAKITFVQRSEHCMSLETDKKSITMLMRLLVNFLTSKEFNETKVVTTRVKNHPDIRDMARIVALPVLYSRYEFSHILDSLREQRYESWFQPIVYAKNALVQPDNFGFESLFRLRNQSDDIIAPHLLFQLADDADMLFQLDLIARRSAVMSASAATLSGKLFINFNPSSIYDPAYCLKATAAFIANLNLKPSDVVFEVTETHRANDVNHLKSILTYYREAGFEVALDDVGAGWSGLSILQQLCPDYIKIDMELIRNIDKDNSKQSIVYHLTQMAKENGISVIAEGIECEQEARWLIQCGVDFLQGFLFGKPSPLPVDALKNIKCAV